jgi:hypothetical protein
MTEFFAEIQEFLAGRKTYITSLSLIIYGLAQWAEPGGTWAEPIASGADPMQLVLEGLGLGTLRAGITKTNGS